VSVAPPGAPPDPGTVACPRCAATIGPDQAWCLECGAPARTRLVPTPNWRAPVAVLAVVVLLAGIGLALAFVALTNDTEPAAPVNSQAPPPSATTAAPAPAAPAQPAPTQSTPTGSTPTTAAPEGDATTSQGTATGQDTATGQSTSPGEGGTATGQSTSPGEGGTTTGQNTSPGEGGTTSSP
jgi:hypothetical protein